MVYPIIVFLVGIISLTIATFLRIREINRNTRPFGSKNKQPKTEKPNHLEFSRAEGTYIFQKVGRYYALEVKTDKNNKNQIETAGTTA